MSLLINNVQCDTFAHVDQRTVANTVKYSLSERNGTPVVAFLYCDGKALPISTAVTAECCIIGINDKETVDCNVGTSGEIIIPIPISLRRSGESLSCEINISGMDDDGLTFRYRAANFAVAVVE